MNAASLQSSASLPAVAAAPVVLWTSGGGATPPAAPQNSVTPAAGQGFEPVSGSAAGAPASTGAPASSGAAGSSGAAQGSDGAAQTGQPQAISAEKGLAAFAQMFGDSFGSPIVAPDGSVYAQAKGVSKSGGKLAVQFIKIGTIDKTNGTIAFTPEVMAKIKDASQKSERKLVKIDDQYVYQTFVTAEDGTKQVAKTEAATEEELKAEQAKQQAAAADKAAKEKAANNQDWVEKLGQVSQATGLFGSVGQFATSLSAGPNAYSGRAGASWFSGYLLATRLNGISGGKLLPSWVTGGPVATALDIFTTGYGMLNVGQSVQDIKEAFGGKGLPAVHPDAVKDLIAKGATPGDAKMLADLGGGLRMGQRAQQMGQALPPDGISKLLVDGRGESAINLGRGIDQATGKVVELGTSRIPTDVVHKAYNATDPMNKFTGIKVRTGVDESINGGLGFLKKFISPALMATAAMSAVTGVMNVKSIAQKYGVHTLFDTREGRSALGSAVSGTMYLGMNLLQNFAPATPIVRGVIAGVDLAMNVISGVTLLDRYGLFGDKGFLNSDAIRSAFLIPPLTPIGALAFIMKNKKERKDEEAKRLEAAKQQQVQQLQEQMKLAQLQLQQGGTIPGATVNKDGSITFATNVPVDASQIAGGAPAAAPAAK